jgi:hypothetical protein
MKKLLGIVILMCFFSYFSFAQINYEFNGKQYITSNKFSSYFEYSKTTRYYDIKDGHILQIWKRNEDQSIAVASQKLASLNGMYLMRKNFKSPTSLTIPLEGSNYPENYYFDSENKRDEFYKFILKSMTPTELARVKDYISAADLADDSDKPSNATLFFTDFKGRKFISTIEPQYGSNPKEKSFITFKTDAIEIIQVNYANNGSVGFLEEIIIKDQEPIIFHDKEKSKVNLYFKNRIHQFSYTDTRSPEEVRTGSLQEIRLNFNNKAAAQEFIDNYKLHALLMPGNFDNYVFNNLQDYEAARVGAFNADREIENRRADVRMAQQKQKALTEGGVLTINGRKIYKYSTMFYDEDLDKIMSFEGSSYKVGLEVKYSVSYNGFTHYLSKNGTCNFTVKNGKVYTGKDSNIELIVLSNNSIIYNGSKVATIKASYLNSSLHNFTMEDIAVYLDLFELL